MNTPLDLQAVKARLNVLNACGDSPCTEPACEATRLGLTLLAALEAAERERDEWRSSCESNVADLEKAEAHVAALRGALEWAVDSHAKQKYIDGTEWSLWAASARRVLAETEALAP